MGIWNWHREDDEPSNIVYVVQFGVHYETYIGGVHRRYKDALREAEKLERENEGAFNGFSIEERELE